MKVKIVWNRTERLPLIIQKRDEMKFSSEFELEQELIPLF